jgi:hypothetical protein
LVDGQKSGKDVAGAKLKQNIWRSLIAVLAGNLIYYSVERYLPVRARHQIYQIDWGLAVDFWFCLACYGIVRRMR